MTRPLALAAVLAALTSVPALAADCPKAIGEGGGILLTRAKPFLSSLYRRSPDGISEARVVRKGGSPEAISATYPHALAPKDRISAANTVTLRYIRPVDTLNDLDRIGTWTSPVSVRVDGAVVAGGTAVKTWLRNEDMQLGGCTYTVWVVDDRLILGQDETHFLQYFAPDLGLVLGSLRLGKDGKPVNGVMFDRIEAVPD